MSIKDFPILETPRLILDMPQHEDKTLLMKHLNQSCVFSENTLNIPFPYTEKDADFFIEELAHKGFKAKTNYTFAIRMKNHQEMIGAIGIHLEKRHHKAEMGYWIAENHWNCGYATEVLKTIIHFGFNDLALHKIYATHYPHNPSSGKVMQKCGMKKEAELRQEFYKNGRFLDVIRYAIFHHEIK